MSWLRYLGLAGLTIMLVGAIWTAGAFHSLLGSALEPYSLQRYADADRYYIAFQGTVEREMLNSRGAELLRQVDPDDEVIRRGLELLWKLPDTKRWFEGQFERSQRNIWDIATGRADRLAPLDVSVLRDRTVDLVFEQFSREQRLVIERLMPDLRSELAERFPMQLDMNAAIGLTERDAETARDAYARIVGLDRMLAWLAVCLAVAGLALWGRLGIGLQWLALAAVAAGLGLAFASAIPATGLTTAMLPSWLPEELRPAVQESLNAMWGEWTNQLRSIGLRIGAVGAALLLLDGLRRAYARRKPSGVAFMERPLPIQGRWITGCVALAGAAAAVANVSATALQLWI